MYRNGPRTVLIDEHQQLASSRRIRNLWRRVSKLTMKTGSFEKYDREAAVEFVSHLTQLNREIVSAVLKIRDLYRQSVGVDQPRTPLDEELAVSMRAKYPALFPADVLHIHYVSPRLQREFIMQETRVDETVVRRVLGADRDYLQTRTLAG